MSIKSICVYCGASTGNSPIFIEKAKEFGKILAEANIELVYGGGSRGLMGAVSNSVLQHGGKVTGIIPQFLIDKESCAEDLKQLSTVIVTENMHQRKAKMFDLADAFVTLPGGIGTIEEIAEIYTLAQLEQHSKPMVFANIENFWQPMAELFENFQEKGFIAKNSKNGPLFISDIYEILPTIKKYL